MRKQEEDDILQQTAASVSPKIAASSTGRDMRQSGSPADWTVIDPEAKGLAFDLREIWKFREVMFILVWRDLKVRYRQTYFGVLWAVMQPLVTMSVFSLFFGTLIGVPSEGAPYPLFALCGLVPWNFFSRAIASMTGSLVGNQELVRRVYLPRMTIPIAAMLSCIVDMLPGFAIILGALMYFSVVPPVQIVLLPLILGILMASTLGIGLSLAAINVRFRDVGYIVPFALQLLLFASPIVYPASIMPEAWRPLYSFNPMVGILEALRWSMIGTEPDWLMIAISSVFSMVLLALGLIFFAKAERAFADVI